MAATGVLGPQIGLIGDTRPETNNVPESAEDSVTVNIGRKARTGLAVGAPVRATHPDPGDLLTYSLPGSDAGFFTIDPASGQIRTNGTLVEVLQNT